MNDKNKIDLSIEMYEDLKETLVKAIKNAKAGGVGNAGWERIERLIEAAERSQGQIAQQLEQLQRNTALSGAKTEQMQEFTDRYNALLAQLAGRLEVIDKENRTIITEILNFKKSLSEFKNEVDTTKFEKLSNHTLWEMKTQIRYLKQPPIVLRTIVFLTVLSILTILATGYLYRDRNEWRGEATYWYKQNDQYKTTQTNKK
jgi:predicted PurR-regulated permease PerM